jgi:fructose-1,6-bisphosphatase
LFPKKLEILMKAGGGSIFHKSPELLSQKCKELFYVLWTSRWDFYFGEKSMKLYFRKYFLEERSEERETVPWKA